MTIISSGELALQNAGTDPSENVVNALLDTTLTTGFDGLLQIKRLDEVGDGNFVDTTVWQGDAYGLNANMFSTSKIHGVFNLHVGGTLGNVSYNSTSNFGSLATSSYTDVSNITRTPSGVFWGIPDASPNNVKLFVFGIGGNGVPNTDNTFSKLEITPSGGTTVTINRTDLSYDPSENGDSFWFFSGSSGTMFTNITNLGTPSSGSSYTVKVISGTTTETRKNGIAEEMGGLDSSDVKMSDYYSPGTFIGSGVSGVPSSGQIKFSDFYGTTHVGFVTSAVEIQPAAKYQNITGGRGHQYEAILHGFGQTYTNTYDSTIGSLNSNMSSSIKTDSAQGSIISSPDLTLWGPAAGSIGTLRSITHFSRGPTQAVDCVMMIIESTGSSSNSGFTNLVATRSGMTALTLARSSATYYYSATNTTRIWLWDDVNYATGNPFHSTGTHESTLFPGGTGSGSANTTTSDRSTWTIS